MKFKLKKKPMRIFWAEIHRLELETEDGEKILCVLQTRSRRRGLFLASWKNTNTFKYYWKKNKKLITDEYILEGLDNIFQANLIKEFEKEGSEYDSYEDSKIFQM